MLLTQPEVEAGWKISVPGVKEKSSSWCLPVISATGKAEAGGLEVQGLELHSEFKASLGN